MFRHMTIGLAAATALMITASAAQAGYSAIAAGVRGYGWADESWPSMEKARDVAVARCRETYGSCSVSTAERDTWHFAAGNCDGEPYTAATGYPASAAYSRLLEIIKIKGAADGYGNCEIDGWF